MSTIIETDNLGKCYRFYNHPLHRVWESLKLRRGLHREFWALKNVYLTVSRGASFGIIGPNGAGKSTLLKILSGITRPTEGRLQIQGRVASILELGTGFHPEFSGRNNIYLNCALHGYTREETHRLLPRIIEFSELQEFIDLPVRMYSTGMYLRLAFSVATEINPDILIVDEALAVGDEHFRNKCMDRMKDFKTTGKTILLVSHDLATVRHFCSHVALLDHGTLQAIGSPDEVLEHYLEMVHRNQFNHSDPIAARFGSPRWGSGEIQVEKVVMKNRQEQVSALFDTHDFAVIDAAYRVTAPVQGVVFGYQIFRSDGTYVHGSNQYWHKIPTRYDFVRTGETGEVRCTIPHLPLLRGQYYLTLCCYNNFDAFPQAVDHWERAYIFTISERWTDQHGIFFMDTEWSIHSSKPIETEKVLTLKSR